MSTRPVLEWNIPIADFVAMYRRSSRRILAAGAVGGLLALIWTSLRPVTYTTQTSFFADGGRDVDLASLRGLAGQFGIPLGNSSGGASPEFFAAILQSRAVLGNVLESEISPDSAAGGGSRLWEELAPRGSAVPTRKASALRSLRGMLDVGLDRGTGIVTVQVKAESPTRSVGIASALIAELNAFNVTSRASRARSEREFAEARTSEGRVRLDSAERRLAGFLAQNRRIGDSPLLVLGRDRLQREVARQQQVLSSLELSLEDARLREIRDTPVLSLVDPPHPSPEADPRGRIKYTLLGAILAGLASLVIVPFVGKEHR